MIKDKPYKDKSNEELKLQNEIGLLWLFFSIFKRRRRRQGTCTNDTL